jgi:ribosomal protein S18 acetylase RimI-like enzyme
VTTRPAQGRGDDYPPYRIVLRSRVTDEDATSLWPVYDAIFGDQPDFETWRQSAWDRHTHRDGFRLALACAGDRLIGFAYGYTGERGQWWTERAFEVLEPGTAAAWLDGHFELVSTGVLSQARGRGVGRALVQGLTEGLPHERWLLMTTADPADPARLLYASDGWQVIGPGVGNGQVIMAKGRPRPSS